MKKLKLLCSAIAALALFALASCDLEIRDLYSNDHSFDGDESGKSAWPFKINGEVKPNAYFEAPKDKAIFDNGISVSFKIVNKQGTDWNLNILQTESTVIYLCILHNGTYDLFPQFASKVTDGEGEDVADDVWATYVNSDSFVTISFNDDGSIAFYKDGALVVKYAEDSTEAGKGTAGAVNKTFLAEASEGGFTLLPKVRSLTIAPAVDDSAAKELYDDFVANN